jgi:lysozyme
MMHISTEGKELIKTFEGLRLNAYRDSAGVWTIGYGSTHYTDGSLVEPGDHLTDEHQADQLFMKTLTDYEQAVNHMVKVPLHQHQFDALVSFAYNVGTGALQSSTLLKKLNEADDAAAADQFLVWNKVTNPKTGKKTISTALKKRREKERALFLTP